VVEVYTTCPKVAIVNSCILCDFTDTNMTWQKGILTIANRRLMQESKQKLTFITEYSPYQIFPFVKKIISYLTGAWACMHA
jgi:hypothetical protein